jgi:outer membrane protease
MEFDYTRGPLLSQAQDTTNKDNFYILYKDIELRHLYNSSSKNGLSANLDYRFNRNHQIYLREMYNSFSDDEQEGESATNSPMPTIC